MQVFWKWQNLVKKLFYNMMIVYISCYFMDDYLMTGSVVVQVKARDDDSGENARILYELLHTPETHSNWFEINQESGIITTKSHIDCEIDPTPILTILAKDHGNPPLTGSAMVVVHLIDTNDTPSK
jgi:hypothetical protein